MRRRRSRRRSDRGRLLGAACLTALALAAAGARADNAVVPDLPGQLGLRGAVDGALQLAVFINGRDAKTIAEFQRGPQGAFSAKRADLVAAGLKPPFGPADGLVRLDAIAGLSYRYDEATQSVAIDVPESQVAPHVYSAAPTPPGVAKAASAWGAALNYDLYGASAAWSLGQRLAFGSGSLTLDGRLFSPVGVVEQSGILGATAFGQNTGLRLDTTWRYDDEDRALTYRAGDVINASLPWTRPIRMGGVQVQHDYGLRPDLVVGPTATASGTAAVPSSVDVYVNNFKIFTQSVDAGPFRIDNLPSIGGNGTATLVLRDVTGKETTQAMPFFVSSRLLAPGVVDYSAEAGYARTFYGVQSFSYTPSPIGSASLRAGLTDWATFEAHGEGGGGLANGGGGLAVNVFNRGVIDAAVAGSRYAGASGVQLALGASTAVRGVVIDASTQRTLASYADLAQATAPRGAQTSILAGLFPQIGTGVALTSPLLLSTSLAPPRALDRVSLTFPGVLDLAALNFSFVNQTETDGETSRIASVGISRSFRNGLSTFADAYVDFANRRDVGVFFGLSYAFANGVAASTQSNLRAGALSQTTQIAKAAGQEIGSVGWSVTDSEGANRYAQASGTALSPYGRATVAAAQYGAGRSAAAQASADVSGSLAAIGGALKLAPAIPDSFALVDAGAPGVAVLEDNRVVGKTDASGELLLTGLRGFQDNKIAIDPTTLPLNAQSALTETSVRPRARSGVVADFKVALDARDAEIILVDEAGAPIPAGARVERKGGASAIVGYDGRAYLSGLEAHNVVAVRTNGKTCAAEFDYVARQGVARPTLGPIACRAASKAAQ